MYFLKKLREKGKGKQLFYERLAEPFHLNLISGLVWLFGSYRSKIDYDLILRPQHAYSILKAADYAKKYRVKTVTLVEFGVATGSGLMNIYKIAQQVTRVTGIHFKIYGFDTGKGMPPARDYRDHPDIYGEGDFAMDIEKLRKILPAEVHLKVGEVGETVEDFINNLSVDEPLGFASVDVDYYYSTKDVMRVFQGTPEQYLPITTVYFDDTTLEQHNSYCGQLLAIREFNEENKYRKLERDHCFPNRRIFQRPIWLKKIFQLHVLDHPKRFDVMSSKRKRVISNPYL